MLSPERTLAAIDFGKNKAESILNLRKNALVRRSKAITDHQIKLGIVSAAVAAPAVQTTGYLLAIGDSWFDYPMHDIVKLLEDEHGYNIESTAKAGAPIEAMAYGQGQLYNLSRSLEKINSAGHSPKAVILSGGGNDIAGKEFGMLLNSALSAIGGWAPEIIESLIEERILDAYQVIIATVTQLCKPAVGGSKIPILVHGYDYPVPDGRGFLGGWLFLPGPWLEPGFKEKLFNDLQINIGLMRALIDKFNEMLQQLAAIPEFSNVHYVDLRGTLSNGVDYGDWWANELHPTKKGFEDVTDKFAAALQII